MTRDELLQALFSDRAILTECRGAVFSGHARTEKGVELGLIGIDGGVPVSIDIACDLARYVLAFAQREDRAPLVILVDTSAQSMTRRDELLGLNEYLAHLAKTILVTSGKGHRTIGILYGKAAAGAFIATALATDWLITVPGAEPSVMDLPSIARVTKLPLERLEELSRTTPIFAPGVEALAATGAVTETWTRPSEYPGQLDALLEREFPGDRRDQLGKERGGRTKAADITRSVMALVQEKENDRLAAS